MVLFKAVSAKRAPRLVPLVLCSLLFLASALAARADEQSAETQPASAPNSRTPAGSQLAPVQLSQLPGNRPMPSSQPIDEILNSTVTSGAGSNAPANMPSLPSDLGTAPILGLPETVTDHEKNRTMRLGPLHIGELIQIAALHPVKLEARYNQPITLRDCLQYALRNALTLRINYQTLEANRYSLLGTASGFLPSTSTTFALTNTTIWPSTAVSSRVFSAAITFPMFQGGAVFNGTLAQYYKMHAAREQYNTSINDTLLNTYNAYYNLLLQRALLQIDIKAVEVDNEQLRLNEQMYYAGTGTRFAVMQSRTQLALDRQTLLSQQVTTRLAVLNLAATINSPLGINLIPVEEAVTESDLVDRSMNISDLLKLGVTHRPELREFEMLRLAAARSVQVAVAPLYPQLRWSIVYGHTSTTVAGPHTELGGLVSASSAAVAPVTLSNGVQAPAVGVTTAGIPVLNGTAAPLTQITPGTGGLTVTPGTANTTFGTATAATTTAGGGATVVTGGAGTLGGAGISSGTTSTNSLSSNGANLPAIGSFGGIYSFVSFQFNMNWTLGQLGATAASNILSARASSRQSLLQCNQALLEVSQQVRSAYANMLSTRRQIDVAATGVASATEELRLANLRLQMGVGTNLELIQSERDYIQALVNQVQAIISSNEAQAQLLHDTGVISLTSLTSGYKRLTGTAGTTR